MGCLGDYLSRPELFIPLLIIFVSIFWWYAIKPLSYWKKRGIPSQPAVPFLGSMPICFWKKYIGEVFACMYNRLEGKKYGGFHNLSKPSIIIRDLDLVKDVLETNFSSFHDNDFEVPSKIDSHCWQNLGFLKGDAWEKQRANLSKAFGVGKVKDLIPYIMEVCETLEDLVSTKIESILDVKEMGECYTTDIISSIAFGTRGDALLNPCGKFRRMGRKIYETHMERFLLIKKLKRASGLVNVLPFFCSSLKAINYFKGVVQEAIHQREQEKVKRPDFLNSLIELHKEGKLSISDGASPGDKADAGKGDSKENSTALDEEVLNNISAQALTFFVNGLTTTSNLISFCLVEFAHNAEVQSKARAEVEKVLEFHGSISQDALLDMMYLDAVLQETVRKYPPSAISTRLATKKYYLPSPEYEGDEGKSRDGIWLEEGSSIVIPVMGIHRDPQYYPNPDDFNPDNFSGMIPNKRHNFAFLGFGKGPRMCIGMKLGMLIAKAAIATLLAKYDFSPCDKTTLPITLDPSSSNTTSKGPVWVKVTSLKKKC